MFNKIKDTFIYRLYKYYILDSIIITKDEGFKILIKKRGIKFIIIIIAYYLVRDLLLYVLIPYLVAIGIF